jgi:hypothetical protein
VRDKQGKKKKKKTNNEWIKRGMDVKKVRLSKAT